MANLGLRRAAKAAGVPLWLIAQELGISEATLSRRLRVELACTDREIIMQLIRRLADQGVTSDGKSKD